MLRINRIDHSHFIFSLLILFCAVPVGLNGYPVVQTRDVVTTLNSPTTLTWGPNDQLWVTERGGKVNSVDPETGAMETLVTIPDVFVHYGAGLLGIAFHPDFETTPHVFFSYTYVDKTGPDWFYLVKVERYTYDAINNSLGDPQLLLDRIEGGYFNNGGSLLMLEDQTLLLALGDGLDHFAMAQEHQSTRGKILRLNLDGTVPSDNPWSSYSKPYSYIWTMGHRNIGELGFGPNGEVVATDVGNGAGDEISIVMKGRNYGWPLVTGMCDNYPGPLEGERCNDSNVVNPIYEWYRGRSKFVTPTDIVYYERGTIEEWNGSFLVGTLEDGLYQLHMRDDGKGVVTDYHYLFSNADLNEYGALRGVALSPEGRIFVASTNRFGTENADKIVELTSVDFQPRTDGFADVETRDVVSNLENPWQIAWGDSLAWVTERRGYVTKIDPEEGTKKRIADLRSAIAFGEEAGLLGVVLHPNFPDSSHVFLSYTYADGGSQPNKLRLVRYTYDDVNEELLDPLVLIDDIPASARNVGGKLCLGSNATIMMAVGDGEVSMSAQDYGNLAGKFLRINFDGTVPEDNPKVSSSWPESLIWSIGFHKADGIALAPSDIVYGVDEGMGAFDELNIVSPNGNMGWPYSEGYCDDMPLVERDSCYLLQLTEPIRMWDYSGEVSDVEYYGGHTIQLWNNSVLITTSNGEELRQLKLSNDGLVIEAENTYFKSEYGKLQDVCAADDGRVFLVTGNGTDDQLIEVRTAPDTTIGDESNLLLRTVAEGLDTPWEVAWGSDGWLWITERPGLISRIDPETGEKRLLLDITDSVREVAGSGMLGMALHPEFPTVPYLFVVYTYVINAWTPDEVMYERLARYEYDPQNDTLINPYYLIDSVEANIYHDGSRVMVLPDKTLMMTTGDAADHAFPQDHTSINGKTLRVNIDGTIPDDNPWSDAPWPSSLIWSTGHRNAQGLTIGPHDIIYQSEHGDDTDDELNIMLMGRNYGYPFVHGYCDDTIDFEPDERESVFCGDSTVVEPIRSWTPTLGVCGMAYYDHEAIPDWKNSLLLVTLGIKKPVLPLYANTLIQLKLSEDGQRVIGERNYFTQRFGRLRAVCVAPDGRVFIASSNEDTRGEPRPGGDRIIEIRPSDFSDTPTVPPKGQGVVMAPNPVVSSGLVRLPSSMNQGRVVLYNSLGKSVRVESFNGGDRYYLERGDLPAGAYCLEISDDENRCQVHFIVQ